MAMTLRRARMNSINNQTQRFFFGTLTFQKEDIDADIFSNPLATGLSPVNYRPVFGGEVALAEDVVGNLPQKFKIMFAQFDALRGSWVRCVVAMAMAMKIDVAEPEAGWNIVDDELQSALWSLANTLLKEVQEGVACP